MNSHCTILFYGCFRLLKFFYICLRDLLFVGCCCLMRRRKFQRILMIINQIINCCLCVCRFIAFFLVSFIYKEDCFFAISVLFSVIFCRCICYDLMIMIMVLIKCKRRRNRQIQSYSFGEEHDWLHVSNRLFNPIISLHHFVNLNILHTLH